MPESRKRKGHPFKRTSDIPASQRTKGRTFWALLIGVFSLLIALFSVGLNYVVLAIALVAGCFIGYLVGKKMETEAKTNR
jgi:Flp pilus assembly protein TadB